MSDPFEQQREQLARYMTLRALLVQRPSRPRMHLSFKAMCMSSPSHRTIIAVVNNLLKRIKAMIETQDKLRAKKRQGRIKGDHASMTIVDGLVEVSA